MNDLSRLTFNPNDPLPALSFPLTPEAEGAPQVLASARGFRPSRHPLSQYYSSTPSSEQGASRLAPDYFTPQSSEELSRLVAQEQTTASRLGRPESYSMVGRRAATGPITEKQIGEFMPQLAERPEYGAESGTPEVLNYINQLEESYNKFSPENIAKMAIQKGIPAAKVPELIAHYSKFRTPVPEHLQKLKLSLTSDRAAELLGGTTKAGKKAAAAEAGKVTQKDREFRQYLREYQGLANKLMKLEGEGGGLLADPTKFEEQRSQLKGEIQKYDNLLQTTSPELYKQIMTGAPAPAAETKSGEGKKLDRETAKVLFQEAGGDKEKARQLAKDRGYTL